MAKLHDVTVHGFSVTGNLTVSTVFTEELSINLNRV